MSIPASIRTGVSGDTDLAAALEDVFDFELTEDESSKIITVQDLFRLVRNKVSQADEGCVRALVFYRLRRALVEIAGIQRNRVQLNSTLELLITEATRRCAWFALQQELDVRLPDLEFAPHIRELLSSAMLFLLSVLLFSGIFAVAIPGHAPTCFVLMAVSAMLMFATSQISGTRAENPAARHLPADCVTIRQLVDQIATWNYGALSKRMNRFSDAEVFEVLRNILVEVLRAKPTDVVPDAVLASFPGCD